MCCMPESIDPIFNQDARRMFSLMGVGDQCHYYLDLFVCQLMKLYGRGCVEGWECNKVWVTVEVSKFSFRQ